MFTFPHTALMPPGGGPVLADVIWNTNLKNVGTAPGDIFRNAGIWGAGEGGGSASVGLTGDGEFTFEIGAVPFYRFIGLGLVDGDWLWDDTNVRYKFNSSSGIWAQSLYAAQTSLGAYGAGETYRITRLNGDDFQWWRNLNLGGGWVLEDSLVGTGVTGTLYPDAALYDPSSSDCLNATLYGVLA